MIVLQWLSQWYTGLTRAKILMGDLTETLLQLHPNIFHGRWPGTDEGLPSGWISIVSTFFTFLESNCTQKQLASFVLEDISEQHGRLALIYRFGTPLRKDQIDVVGARAFFTRNRCAVSCVNCEKIAEELLKSGASVQCQACICAASDRYLTKETFWITRRDPGHVLH